MTQLYSRLFRYRARQHRAPLEDFLSEALVDLVERMPPAVAIALVAEMLGPYKGAFERWTGCGNARRLKWITQQHVTEPARGYIDILLEIDGVPALIIENKLGSGVRAHGGAADDDECTSSQLTTYGRWLSARTAPTWGGALVLLTHLTPSPDDFFSPAADPKYGVRHRAVVTWSWMARRLRKMREDPAPGAAGAWHPLASDFLVFLEEHEMTAETASATDVAALQIFLPTAGRLFGTFERVWKALATARQDMCTNRVSSSDFRTDAGLVWSWAYTKAPAPRSSYLALGIRFPDQSDWWQGADLPSQPHAFLMLGSDNDDLPLDAVTNLPEAWRRIETDLVAALPLSSLPSDADGLADALSEWATRRAAEAVSMVRAMSD